MCWIYKSIKRNNKIRNIMKRRERDSYTPCFLFTVYELHTNHISQNAMWTGWEVILCSQQQLGLRLSLTANIQTLTSQLRNVYSSARTWAPVARAPVSVDERRCCCARRQLRCKQSLRGPGLLWRAQQRRLFKGKTDTGPVSGSAAVQKKSVQRRTSGSVDRMNSGRVGTAGNQQGIPLLFPK